MSTLYNFLGVRSDASDHTIKEAFRKAVKAYHPDLHAGDPDAPLRFRQIVAAYGILRDAGRRAAYDQFLKQERRQHRSTRARTIISEVISVAALTLALAGGYALFAPLITTGAAVAEKDKHDKQAATAAVAFKENEAKAIATLGKDATVGKDGGAGGQAQMAAAQPAARAKTMDADQAGHEHDRADVPHACPGQDALVEAGMDTGFRATPAVAKAGDCASEEKAVRIPIHSIGGRSNETSQPRITAPPMDHGDAQVIASDAPSIGLASDNPKFYRDRGILSYRRGDFRRAIDDFDQAIRLDADDAQAYNLRGNALDEIGDFERALADYDEAIRLDPNNPAMLRDRAILWRRKGELDKALVDLDRAIRFSFSDANIYSDRGLIWYEKGRRDRAIADFNRAVKLDPSFATAYINRGLIAHGSGELSLATADADKAIRVDAKVLDAIQNANLRP